MSAALPSVPVDTRYYIDQWNDEVVPCDCTLSGWAAFLCTPDPAWNHLEPPAHGAVFQASTLLILYDVAYTVDDAGVHLRDAIPTDTTTAFLRYGGPDTGWDPENSVSLGGFIEDPAPDQIQAMTALARELTALVLANHVAPYDPEQDWGIIACTRDGPRVLLRYVQPTGDDTPYVEVVGPVQ